MLGCVCLLNVVSEHSDDEAGLVTYIVLVNASFRSAAIVTYVIEAICCFCLRSVMNILMLKLCSLSCILLTHLSIQFIVIL
jgi:hypothetical protein